MKTKTITMVLCPLPLPVAVINIIKTKTKPMRLWPPGSIPVHEGPLGVHQVELVVEPGPGLGDGRRVGQHAHGSAYLRQVAAGHHGWWLVVNPHLEASGTPVHKLDAALGLDGGDGSVDILGHDISSVEETAGHVLPMPGVALH